MRTVVILIISLILLGSVVVVPASANGKPVTIFLYYAPELSTYEPAAEATGKAQVSISEAWIEVEGTGLPSLDGERYEVWLREAGSDVTVSAGTFNADAEGNVTYKNAKIENLPLTEYRYVLVTVEPSPDPEPDVPDRRVALAGIFPNPVLVVGGTPTPTLAPDVTPSPAAPTELPVTGERRMVRMLRRGSILVGVVLLATLAMMKIRE